MMISGKTATYNWMLLLKKSFKNGISIFAKASNLLDTPLLRFIQNGPHTESVNSERKDGNVIERKEWHRTVIHAGNQIQTIINYKLDTNNNFFTR